MSETETGGDAVLTQELLHNQKVIDMPILGRIVVRRPTPRQDALISEARRKQYHADLKDETILSRAELLDIATKRGMWSAEKTKEMQDLNRTIGEMVTILDFSGYDTEEDISEQYMGIVAFLKEESEDEEVQAAIDRYFDIEVDSDLEDAKLIIKNSTGTKFDEQFQKGKLLRTQVDLLKELGKNRTNAEKLQEEYTRLFRDSIESRMERAERMEKLLHCVTREETGEPVFSSIEDLMECDPMVLIELQNEMFFFEMGIAENVKEILGKYRFTVRMKDILGLSEDSPDHPQSNSDGESPPVAPMSSSDSTE